MISTNLVILLAAVAALGFLIALSRFAKNYIEVPLNTAAIFTGRKHVLPDGRVVGYRIVTGDAAFKWPLLEQVDYLSLNGFTIPLEIKRANTLKGVPISVEAVASVKIRSDRLCAAAERFLGMPRDQVQKLIYQTLDGHL